MKPKTLPEIVTLLKALPSDTAFTAGALTAWLSPLVDRQDDPAPSQTADVDLTVPQVAERFGRGLSTVRGWITAGEFPSAYRLQGREWRVPHGDVQAMQQRQAERFRATQAPAEPDADEVDLDAWRHHLKAS